MKKKEGNEAVSVYQAQRLTGKHPSTLREMIYAGTLRAQKVGRRWLIPMSEIRRLTEQGAEK